MEWIQVFTIIGSITVTLMGAVFAFYRLTRDEIAVIREDMRQMNDAHREDIQRMDARWERLFEKMDAKLEKMDLKWERLLEK